MKFIWCIVLALLPWHWCWADQLQLSVLGTAKDASSGDILYIERHFTRTDSTGNIVQREVLYERPSGELIAKKENSASQSAWVPSFTLSDLRSGYSEALNVTDESFVLRLREIGKQTWQEKRIRRDNRNWVADAGFDPFVRDHLALLQRGESVDFWFLSPARQAAIPFRLRPIEQEDGQIRLLMVLQNALLRLLVDPIELVYEIDSQRLMSFAGITNLSREDGKHYEAIISYVYP